MLSSSTMKLAKALLVALALWIPAASFAAAVCGVARLESQAPCEEPAAEETSEQSELELLLPSSDTTVPSLTAHTVRHESHRPLDGHIAELHSPPPNSALR